MHNHLGVLLGYFRTDCLEKLCLLNLALLNLHLIVHPCLLVLGIWDMDGAADRTKVPFTVRAHV